MATYREILSDVLKKTAPDFFAVQPMPRNLMLKNLVPKQTGIVLTQDECNKLARIFQKLIDGASLTSAEDNLLDSDK